MTLSPAPTPSPAETESTLGPHRAVDYLSLPDDGRRFELLYGQLYELSGPTIRHQVLVGLLYQRLLAAQASTGAGIVLFAPIDVRLADHTIVQPDLLWLPFDERVSEACIEGAPTLVVEVLSPATRSRDLGPKRRAYFEGGAEEVWLVDPAASTVIADSVSGPIDAVSGTVRSRVLPAFAVEAAALFADAARTLSA